MSLYKNITDQKITIKTGNNKSVTFNPKETKQVSKKVAVLFERFIQPVKEKPKKVVEEKVVEEKVVEEKVVEEKVVEEKPKKATKKIRKIKK